MGGGPEVPTTATLRSRKLPKEKYEYKVIVTGMGVCKHHPVKETPPPLPNYIIF